MAGNTNYAALATTTLQNYVSKKLEDNVFRGVPTLNAIKAKGGIGTKGGDKLLYPLLYGKNTTIKTMTPFGVFDMTPQEGITAAEFQWANLGGTVVMDNFTLDVQNSGEAQVIDLLQTKINQLELSMTDYLNYCLWTARSTGYMADGTTSRTGPYELWSLVDAISPAAQTDPTYTGDGTGYGRIPLTSAATDLNVWWRSMSFDGTGQTDPSHITASADTALYMPTSDATFNIANLSHIYNMCSNGSDSPNLIVMPMNVYEKFESLLTANMRYSPDNQMLEAGIQHINWRGCPVMFDRSCTAGVIYLLNTKYLKFITCTGRNMKATPFEEPVNQDVRSSKVIWTGQLACSNRSRQGKWSSVTSTD